jgi:hypothetical protein
MKEKSIYEGFPPTDHLLDWYAQQEKLIPDVNGHIHTPCSFSAFSDIEQAFQMALSEGISVLGINDFYTTSGYEEFAHLAGKFRIFPLFNIEFMALQYDLQHAGIRVNDPNNPGRTYFSGKGLRYPAEMSESSEKMIAVLQRESNRQTYQMVEKLNAFFRDSGIGIHFNAEELHKKIAKGLFRERHIAQAIRQAVFEKEKTAAGRIHLFKKIFSGKELKSSLDDYPLIENEVRGHLLKAGGVAFVPEDPEAFLSLEKVIEIIIDAGGIPCYPVLLDDPRGNFTDYEADWNKLLDVLIRNDVYAIELIPGRNDFQILKNFVTFFHQNGFLVTFGTEHNTSQLDPLTITCRNGVPLDEELKKVNYEGASVVAAHQYLISQGEEGYLSGRKAKMEQKKRYAELGNAVIAKYIKMR